MARPHVVIIGGGFGGLYAARALRSAERRRHCHRQDEPSSLSAAALSGCDRRALSRRHNRADQARVTRPAEHKGPSRRGARDRRASAGWYRSTGPGARYHTTISSSRLAHVTRTSAMMSGSTTRPGLKAIEDAAEIRRRFLLAFERAEKSEDETEREEYMTFVVVGGGPTGVEIVWRISYDRPARALSRIFVTSIRGRRESFSSKAARACFRRSPNR